MSFSVPGTTMTPVPITKLPAISAQRARGSGALAAPVRELACVKEVCGVKEACGSEAAAEYRQSAQPDSPPGNTQSRPAVMVT